MHWKKLAILIIFLYRIDGKAQTIVKSADPRIHYMGRVLMSDSAAMLSWTANSISINFTGTGVNVMLKDEGDDNNYNIIVDGKVTGILHPRRTKQLYKLVSGLPKGKHKLELFKRTEWAMGKTWFYHFKLDKGTKLLAAPETNKRKIEFFGNSITCGYADEDTTGKDRGTGTYENGYISYAAFTARHYNAEFYNTSKSGIGITVSWFPLIMPEMYDRLDASDPNSKWDFSKYTPDVVVVNLFQNDSWLVNMHENEQFKARFGNTPPTPEFIINAYQHFIKSIRLKYPVAQIICILGSMDATKAGSPWPGYIQQAVAPLKDKNIYTHFIPYKDTSGHPSAKEQQDMADDLIKFMDTVVRW